MKTSNQDFKKILNALINLLDDGIIIIMYENEEIIMINNTAIHFLSHKLFKLSDKRLEIKEERQYKHEELLEKNLKNISKYFELYPTTNNIIVSVNAKDETHNSTMLYRKVLRIDESKKTYYIIIIKIG